jgi:hypothetical protein
MVHLADREHEFGANQTVHGDRETGDRVIVL